MFQSFAFRLLSSSLNRPLLINISFVSKNTRLFVWMDVVNECVWMSFVDANVWKSFENSKSSKGKFRQKVVFFRWRDETWTSLCVLQLEVVCAFDVLLDVEVVCVCRPSSRLSLNIRPCIDFVPYLWHSVHNSSLIYDFFFTIRPYLRLFSFTLFSFTRGWGRGGGLRGGVTQRV